MLPQRKLSELQLLFPLLALILPLVLRQASEAAEASAVKGPTRRGPPSAIATAIRARRLVAASFA